MSQTRTELNLNGRKITLIGTAHISEKSVQEVSETIRNIKPDCVAVELDEKRYDSIKNPEKYGELDIIKVLRNGEAFLLLANLVLASFQKRMGKNTGVKPGEEMVSALNVASELGINYSLVDRPVQTTLKRAWGKNNRSGKSKLLTILLTSAFSREQVSEDQIENLKQKSEMDSMMGELSEYLPAIKEVLIDERDFYLASHIWESKGENIVAVLGAGHLAGVQANLEKIASGELSTDTTEIEKIPPKKKGAKIIGWMIPVIILALIAAGFYFGGRAKGVEFALNWFLWNGIPSAVGALVAAGHPLAVLVSFVAAPFTSLCPVVGVGIVSGIVQAYFCKPKVKDLESLSEDAGTLKGFYKNRILRVLLVFILSSLGSSIGTFAASGKLISLLSGIFNAPELE